MLDATTALGNATYRSMFLATAGSYLRCTNFARRNATPSADVTAAPYDVRSVSFVISDDALRL